jgi:arylsulfatase A-like enzyme/Tfp pilus assembly protein PilF
MRASNNLLVSTTAALAAACGGAQPAGPIPPTAPSVLLVTLDTTRADHLGCYGHGPALTPQIDSLAARGVRFERAYSQVPLTLPSHASLMSGVLPRGTGLHVNFEGAIHGDVPLLAEMFAASGYRTGAFLAAWVLNRDFGLARGFGTYDDLADRAAQAQDIGQQVERDATEITDAALAWLAREPEQRFFLWVHYFDAHDPYEPPEAFAHAATAYDGEIAYIDSELGRLLTWLEKQGRTEDTLVVVTSDHGEGLGDHGETTHGLFLYDSTLRVPLIFSWPASLEPRTVEAAVGLVDLHPTIVELCGAQASSLVEGRSLVAGLRRGALSDRPLYAEAEYSLRSFGWAPLQSVRSAGWKYIKAPRAELFEVTSDPGELRDLSASETEVLAGQRRVLANLLAGSTGREASKVELTPGADANLAALGYLGGAALGALGNLEGLRDPKDCREVYSGTMRAKQLSDRGLHSEVVQLLIPLVAESPESDEVWSLLASSLLELGRYAEAREAFEKSLRRRPDLPGRLTSLGDAHLGLGDLEAALEALSRAAEAAPRDGKVQGRLGLTRARRGEFPAAEAHFKRQRELEPESPNAPTNLANVLFSQAKFDAGLAQLDLALELDPRCKPAWIGRLRALVATGRIAEARATVKRCIAALPGDPAFHQTLSVFARSTGDAVLIELVDELTSR